MGDYYYSSNDRGYQFEYPYVYVVTSRHIRVHKVNEINGIYSIGLSQILTENIWDDSFFMFRNGLGVFASLYRMFITEQVGDSLLTKYSLFGYYVDGDFLSDDSLAFCNDGIYDVSDPYNPVLVYDSVLIHPFKIGDRVFHIDRDSDYPLKITDISDPSNPVLIDSVNLGVDLALTFGTPVIAGNTLIYDFSIMPTELGFMFIHLDDQLNVIDHHWWSISENVPRYSSAPMNDFGVLNDTLFAGFQQGWERDSGFIWVFDPGNHPQDPHIATVPIMEEVDWHDHGHVGVTTTLGKFGDPYLLIYDETEFDHTWLYDLTDYNNPEMVFEGPTLNDEFNSEFGVIGGHEFRPIYKSWICGMIKDGIEPLYYGVLNLATPSAPDTVSILNEEGVRASHYNLCDTLLLMQLIDYENYPFRLYRFSPGQNMQIAYDITETDAIPPDTDPIMTKAYDRYFAAVVDTFTLRIVEMMDDNTEVLSETVLPYLDEGVPRTIGMRAWDEKDFFVCAGDYLCWYFLEEDGTITMVDTVQCTRYGGRQLITDENYVGIGIHLFNKNEAGLDTAYIFPWNEGGDDMVIADISGERVALTGYVPDPQVHIIDFSTGNFDSTIAAIIPDVATVKMDVDTLWLFTGDNEVSRFRILGPQDTTTVRSQNTFGVVPEVFEVGDVYPNPFNSSCTIDFSLSETSLVKLSIFNLLGQEVFTEQRRYTYGRHGYSLNASKHDLAMSNGIYFLVMQSGGVSHIRKLLYVK
ncbi:T9SS type A sorting domain-containing protein [bacterium]|nr:T9SS type A sorting domain-containing protein [bacterium]